MTVYRDTLSGDDVSIKKFFENNGGYEVLSMMRNKFCRTGRPSDAVECAYDNGRNSVILELYELIGREK